MITFALGKISNWIEKAILDAKISRKEMFWPVLGQAEQFYIATENTLYCNQVVVVPVSAIVAFITEDQSKKE